MLVDFPPAEAFELFTSRIASWWPASTHSLAGDAVREIVLEPGAGGRLYEITDAGEDDWGRVLEWDPPHRLLLDWQVGNAAGTEVEVRFSPEGPGSRVELEHRGFASSEPRESYNGGWDGVLAPFVASASKKA